MKTIQSLVHDLSNKITIAQGHVYRAQKEHEADQKINTAFIALNRSIEILRCLKDYCNHGVKPLDVECAIDGGDVFFNRLQQMYGIKLTMDLETVRERVMIDIDQADMCRIIENVVENAAKAGAKNIHFSDKVNGDFVTSTLSDDGEGCKPEDLAKIGTGWTIGGTGNGTVIMKRHMLKMGGDIKWELNKNGRGMSVILTIRVSKPTHLVAA